MSAPGDLATWMATHEHKDKKLPHVYRYHSRSDIHSVMLCEFVMRDLLRNCASLREQALSGEAAYGINVKHKWETTGKAKALDLAVGPPTETALSVPSITLSQIRRVKNRKRKSGTVPEIQNALSRLLIACEAKAVMTEHGKSQPRLFDELSSSHEIVHQGDQETIAAGIVMVNIASSFVSPLRQKDAERLDVSRHQQPMVTTRMIQHLRDCEFEITPARWGLTRSARLSLIVIIKLVALYLPIVPLPNPATLTTTIHLSTELRGFMQNGLVTFIHDNLNLLGLSEQAA